MDMPLWGTILITLIGSGAVAAAVNALSERNVKHSTAKQIDANGAGEITDAAIALVQPLKDQILHLQHRLDAQDIKYVQMIHTLEQYAKHIEYLMTGISRLIQQLADAGIAPCWTPATWKPDPEVKE